MSKKTLILGATPNPQRYAFTAAYRLNEKEHPLVLVGIKKGNVLGYTIQKEIPLDQEIDTVTLYVGPRHQAEYFDKLVNLKPQRVIFNPGTENPALEKHLKKNKIETIQACTLVMLATGQY